MMAACSWSLITISSWACSNADLRFFVSPVIVIVYLLQLANMPKTGAISTVPLLQNQDLALHVLITFSSPEERQIVLLQASIHR